MIRHRTVSIAAAGLAALALHAVGLADAGPGDPSAEALAARAQAILDRPSSSPDALDEAQGAIEASLAKGMNAHALVEGARLTLIRGDESPESLRRAKEMLRAAEQADPAYDRTYVLQGYVAIRMDDMDTARIALLNAEKLHSRDPWLKLNYALYYERTGDEGRASLMREVVVASRTTNEKAMGAALGGLEEYYMRIGERMNTDRVYRLRVSKWPDAPYIRGDYARGVITQFADFDAGERAAREALAIMDYPHARQTVSLALYGRWAAAKRDRKDLAVVRELLDKARAYDPDASMVPTCAFGSPKLAFLKDALLALEARYDPTLHNC